MDDILELILNVIFPNSKFNQLQSKINTIPNDTLRKFLKILLWVIPFGLIFTLSCGLNFLIKGYWI